MWKPRIPNIRVRKFRRTTPMLAAFGLIILILGIYPLAMTMVKHPTESLAGWLADGATATVAVIVALAATEIYTRHNERNDVRNALRRVQRELALNVANGQQLLCRLKGHDGECNRIMYFPDVIWKAKGQFISDHLEDDEVLYGIHRAYGMQRIVQKAETNRVRVLQTHGADNDARTDGKAGDAAVKNALRAFMTEVERTQDILDEYLGNEKPVHVRIGERKDKPVKQPAKAAKPANTKKPAAK